MRVQCQSVFTLTVAAILVWHRRGGGGGDGDSWCETLTHGNNLLVGGLVVVNKLAVTHTLSFSLSSGDSDVQDSSA